MKFLTMRKVILITIIITSILAFSGCSQKNQKSGTSSNTEGEKPPEALTQIEQNIDSIIDTLDKEGKVEEDKGGGGAQGQGQQQEKRESTDKQSEGQKSGEKDKKTESKEGGSDQGGGGSSGGSQQGGGGSQGTQQKQQPTSPWDQVDKTIRDIHRRWNEYQPQAVQAGASPELINNFSATLNALTNDVSTKNIATTLNNANSLYKYIPDFFSHHKDKSVDLKRLKYFTRDVMYESRFDRWNIADESIASAKALLPNLRAQSNEQTKQTYQSLEYSVTDLEKVEKDRQKFLTQLKGNIVLSNLKNIEKQTQKNKTGGGGGAGAGGSSGASGGAGTGGAGGGTGGGSTGAGGGGGTR